MNINNLKAYVANNNMTLKQFAQSIGFSPQYLSNICRGTSTPGRWLVYAVKNATNGVVDLQEKVKKRKPREKSTQKSIE